MASPSLKHASMCLLFAATLLSAGTITATGVPVELLRVPQGGIQPQAAIDGYGTIHLVYFRGEPSGGNLFYATRGAREQHWSDPIRVNSEAGSGRRNGAISHAQLALGANRRVHVSWFNMRPPKYFYTRSREDAPGFEKQRNLVTDNVDGVETGASVAADGSGSVAIVWHAGSIAAEDARGVFARVSRDHGLTFGPESRIDDDRGVCACCGLSAVFSRDGGLYALYRAATALVHRDITLLKSTDHGKSFSADKIHEWNIGACPVSTTRITAGPGNGVLMAWETKGQVFVSRAGTDEVLQIVAAPGEQRHRRKNPLAVMNPSGATLLVWGDGPGWRSGGALSWQVFDADWKATHIAGSAEEMPEYSVPEALARPDGSFVVIY